jgi:arginyl-tRNA synthetase
MKKVIAKLIFEALEEEKVEVSKEEIENTLEIPPTSDMGDFAFPCFIISKKMKIPPNEVALIIRQNIGSSSKKFQDIQTAGPYVNFFLDRKVLALNIISEIKKKKSKYGAPEVIKDKKKALKTMVEFPSPNTNKPLHLGHLRNMSIGESVSRILEFNGEKVFRANLNNDRGIHICKSMTAYEEFSEKLKKKDPKKEKIKPDHFVGEFYVLFNKKVAENPDLEVAAHRMLRHWEQGNKKTIELWKKMNSWALEGFQETYKKFGIKHDVTYSESDLYKKGKEIILNGLKKGIFQKRKDGAVLADLNKEHLGEKVLLRIDGTSVYITQDLYLAKLKHEKYNLDKSIYVVGNEQDYHFKVLFSLLKKLGFDSKNLYHLSYGLVELPEGKMKSREGTVVDADDILDQMQNLAKKELKKRAKLSEKELDKKSLIIALAAIKYMLLKVDTRKNMLFNPKESISFEGDTGPYILYTYARASSILRKLKKEMKIKYWEGLDKKEVELIKKLQDFKKLSEKAYLELNPTIIANYAYQLAQIFNEFYHECPVIGSEKEHFRINLVKCFRQVLKNSLDLIGIETLEEM